MQPTSPNANGVLQAGHREIVATSGSRAYAALTIALCDDGLYRYGLDMHYSYGGFGFPIFTQDPGYPTLQAARAAALEHLLKAWHTPFPSDPDSVQRELNDMRRQIEGRIAQPTLFRFTATTSSLLARSTPGGASPVTSHAETPKSLPSGSEPYRQIVD